MTGPVPGSPSYLAASAHAAAMAWLDSGAGTVPSQRAKRMPAANASSCSTVVVYIRPSSTACDTIGAIAW